ncbi:MAG: HAD-IA family hydrolase [Candidatus Woesebacteria bacterium]|jgi:HAD superfamily hydrolase (TIGR01548 family)
MQKINFDQLDGLIWDMDGVLIDVSKSYRLCILKTVQYFCPDKTVTELDVLAIKQVVGLNNDWDASYALILKKQNSKFDIPEFISNLEKYRKDKLYQNIVAVFQSYYLGSSLYQKCYSKKAPVKKIESLINTEKLLIPKSVLDNLKKKYKKMGIATGRPKFEAIYALKNNNILDLFNTVIAMEDYKNGKPEPEPLLMVSEKLALKNTIYIGDSSSDVEAAKRAQMPCIYIGEKKLGNIQIINIETLWELLL